MKTKRKKKGTKKKKKIYMKKQPVPRELHVCSINSLHPENLVKERRMKIFVKERKWKGRERTVGRAKSASVRTIRERSEIRGGIRVEPLKVELGTREHLFCPKDSEGKETPRVPMLGKRGEARRLGNGK